MTEGMTLEHALSAIDRSIRALNESGSREQANELAEARVPVAKALSQTAQAVDVEAKLSWALEQGGMLADWCNVSGDALRALMSAYERRVRSACETPEQIEKQPWSCAEFVQAEEALRTKPTPVVAISGEKAGQVGDVDVARFVEEAAKIISGAPFPSGRSLFKARKIADLMLSLPSSHTPDKEGGV